MQLLRATLRAIFGVPVIAMLSGAPVLAQSADKLNDKLNEKAARAEAARQDAARQLELRKELLSEAERKAQALQQEMRLAKEEQASINERLIETGQQVQRTEARMTELEQRLSGLEVEERQARANLNGQHGRIVKLFSAMQRMGRNPPPVIVTQRADALAMVRSAMLLARAFPELKSEADVLAAKLGDLVRVTTQIRSDGDQLKLEAQNLVAARRELGLRMEAKRKLVADQQKELEEVRRSATEIAKGVTDLGDLISRLDKAVAEHTAMGAYNREQARIAAEQAKAAAAEQARIAAEQAAAEQARVAAEQAKAAAAEQARIAAEQARVAATEQARIAAEQAKAAAAEQTRRAAEQARIAAAEQAKVAAEQAAAAAAAKAAAGAAPIRPSIAELSEAPKSALGGPRPQGPSIALEPRGTHTASLTRMAPAVPFHLAKGQLPLPAQGRKLISFGEKTQFGSTSKGIVIETRSGATVTSPCDGWIVYAGEFRSYGQVLIINAGNGYHVLLANLSRIDVEVGRFVLASEPVGTMSANLKGKGQDSAPVLYVEFRNKEGQSIDPEPWWVEAQKVQG